MLKESLDETEIKGVVDQILADVAKTADDLEESLNQNLFEAALEDVSSILLHTQVPSFK